MAGLLWRDARAGAVGHGGAAARLGILEFAPMMFLRARHFRPPRGDATLRLVAAWHSLGPRCGPSEWCRLREVKGLRRSPKQISSLEHLR